MRLLAGERDILVGKPSTLVEGLDFKHLFRWKHAALCHQNSSLEAAEDMYEKDEIYDGLYSKE